MRFDEIECNFMEYQDWTKQHLKIHRACNFSFCKSSLINIFFFVVKGRAVQTAKSLDEGLNIINSLSPSNQIFGSNEGKLVHLSDRLRASKVCIYVSGLISLLHFCWKFENIVKYILKKFPKQNVNN